MPVVLRPDDPIDPDDDDVIRAGGASVEALVAKALDTAEAYGQFVDQGLIRSPYAISVNVPRAGVASLDDLLGDVPFKRYKPYLEAPAAALLSLGWVEIVATKTVMPAKTTGLITIKNDYASFPSDGRGSIRVPDGVKLKKGQHVAVTDDEADTVEAEVVAEPANGRAEVRLNWTKVLHVAD